MCFVICSKKANIERLMRGRCWGGCKLHVIDQLFQMVAPHRKKTLWRRKSSAFAETDYWNCWI